MTPSQALQLLSDVTGRVPTDRQQHLLILQAIEVLKGAIAPKQPVETEAKVASDNKTADVLNKAGKEKKE